MNVKSMQLLKYIVITSILIVCNLACAEGLTVAEAKSYPYRNLIDRTDSVKIFYTTNDGEQSCRVEVALDKMKWISVKAVVKQDVFSEDKLSNCLSRGAAEQILFQTFLQFGRGL
jgi:hypothetical protein